MYFSLSMVELVFCKANMNQRFTVQQKAIVSLIICILSACSKPIPSQSKYVIGTYCTITLYDKGRPSVYREIFNRLGEIENRMSTSIEGSDIYKVNKSAGIEAVKVHDDVFTVVERALHFAALSEGAFDPTVEPLVSLWGIGGDNPGVPPPEEIERLLPLINWRGVVLDKQNETVFLEKPGMALDLGAIAKGYAADEAAKIIKNARIPQAIIDLGGNIMTVGEKKDKSLWRIGIQNPLDGRGAFIGIVELMEKSVVTSGVYERYFISDGVHYHHILDPSIGYPAQSGLLSVTIVSESSMDADALATAAFVLGYDKGRALVESLEGVEAVFVFEDKTVRKTAAADFSINDETYTLVYN